MKFYVETSRPPVSRGVRIRVMNEREYSHDALSPNMTAVFEVDACRTKQEAIACVVEHAAGHTPLVRLLYGGAPVPRR